jgi:hypothetical protein
MIKYALTAAVAALALGAPVMAEAQMSQPVPLTNPTNPVISNTSTATTVTTQPQAGTDGTYGFVGQPALVQPDMMPTVMVAVPPGAVWIPGHYNWDAASQNYVWIDGQFALPPRPNAQWLAGHWQETPTSWMWIDERWN